MFAGRSGRRSGWRGPELRDAEYLIDRECHHAEHEVAFDLDRAAHAHGPCAEFILQSGVDAFGQGAKIKNHVVRIGHMDEFHALDFFGPFYAHFPSKEALEAEAVERAFAQSDRRVYALTSEASDKKQAFLDNYLSAAHRDHPGSGCAIAALGPEIARDSAARKPFTQRVKHMIDGMTGRFRWKRKDAARRNAIHLLSAAVGALVLARAVDDPRLSDEILESVRDSLASL